jgi:hypothetical protein
MRKKKPRRDVSGLSRCLSLASFGDQEPAYKRYARPAPVPVTDNTEFRFGENSTQQKPPQGHPRRPLPRPPYGPCMQSRLRAGRRTALTCIRPAGDASIGRSGEAAAHNCGMAAVRQENSATKLITGRFTRDTAKPPGQTRHNRRLCLRPLDVPFPSAACRLSKPVASPRWELPPARSLETATARLGGA